MPRARVAALIALVAVMLALGLPGAGTGDASAKSADDKRGFRGCRLQKAQSFLKRTWFVRGGQLQAKRHLKALRYRIEKYGSLPDLEMNELNSRSVATQVRGTRFFGLPLQVHEKVALALRCVENRIRKSCKKKSDRYTPKAVGGFRQGNTYRGQEVSNHLFGIAVDIDPDRNPCCGCVDPWPTHKLCQGDAPSIYDRTSLPRCWVRAFERYGFWWLGRDTLKDTMHFEFLGNPERIEP